MKPISAAAAIALLVSSPAIAVSHVAASLRLGRSAQVEECNR
jgi:hypothetical protein